MKHEDYVWSYGRAGRTGQAITLATYRERGKIRALEDYLDARLSVSEIEGLSHLHLLLVQVVMAVVVVAATVVVMVVVVAVLAVVVV